MFDKLSACIVLLSNERSLLNQFYKKNVPLRSQKKLQQTTLFFHFFTLKGLIHMIYQVVFSKKIRLDGSCDSLA